MKITIKGKLKEVAALEKEVQKRQTQETKPSTQTSKYREILEKQLQLLSERSQNCPDEILEDLTEAMICVVEKLIILSGEA